MNLLDRIGSLPPLAKIALGVVGLTGVIALSTRSERRAATLPPGEPAKAPGERVRPGDRFEADLSGFLGNQTRPDLNAPGQIFEAVFVRPSGLPSPAGQEISGRHETTGARVLVPSAFVTRIL